jgi:hypothetical protein
LSIFPRRHDRRQVFATERLTQGLRRRSALEPIALMRALEVVISKEAIEVALDLVDFDVPGLSAFHPEAVLSACPASASELKTAAFFEISPSPTTAIVVRLSDSLTVSPSFDVGFRARPPARRAQCGRRYLSALIVRLGAPNPLHLRK